MDSALLEKQAIKAAITGSWKEAVELNQEILNFDPNNVAALNRLGRAHWEIGNLKMARLAFQSVINLDQYNTIALKNLKRLGDSEKSAKPVFKKSPFLKETFLEEPGKTKTVKLMRLTNPQALSGLNSGDSVEIAPKKRGVHINREDGVYLGSLPDDLAQKLSQMIRKGNRYQSFVKSVDRQHLEIFIREVFRSRRYGNRPSFGSSSVNYIPFISPEVVHSGKPETTPTGESDDQ